MGTRCPGEPHGVPHDILGGWDLSHHAAEPQQVLAAEDMRDGLRLGRRGLTDDGDLVVLGQVVDRNVEHEPVELGFRQRIRAFHLDGILRGEDEERLAEPVADAGRSHVVFLHCLEHGRLRLGRRAVDLIGQDHIGEDGPFDERHRPLVVGLLEDLGARDIGGHQVRRELDPPEPQIEQFRQRFDQQGLRQARRAGQQAVSPRKHGNQQMLDHVLLADDHLREFRPDALSRPFDLFDCLPL